MIQVLDTVDSFQEKTEDKRSTPPQYDAAWIEEYREIVSFDFLGMLSPTRFTTSRQRADWKHLFALRSEQAVQLELETLLSKGKERELLSAVNEKREPKFSYPAILLNDVQQRIDNLQTLQEKIVQLEENMTVRQLYAGERGAIPYNLHQLSILKAATQRRSKDFWKHVTAVYPVPTISEMRYALSRVKWFIERGEEQEHTRAVSQRLTNHLKRYLSLNIEDLPNTEELQVGPPLDVSLYGKPAGRSGGGREVPPETVRNLFAALFRDQGCIGWNSVIDYAARNTRIDPALRRYVVAGVPYTISQVLQQVAHEWGAHIEPRVAGDNSSLGLLGIGTGWSLEVEEGVGYYLEWELAKRVGHRFDESKLWIGTLATGLAAGVMTPPQTFQALYQFFVTFLTLYRLIWRGDEDEEVARERAKSLAQTRCLRTFRGVPSRARPGICFTKDAGYQRGFFKVYDAVQEDPTILDWLGSGIVAIEQIPDLQALDVSPVGHSSRALLERPDLEAYVLSLQDADVSAHDVLM